MKKPYEANTDPPRERITRRSLYGDRLTRKAAHVARKAFAEAADEADILVGSAKDNPVSMFLAKARAR